MEWRWEKEGWYEEWHKTYAKMIKAPAARMRLVVFDQAINTWPFTVSQASSTLTSPRLMVDASSFDVVIVSKARYHAKHYTVGSDGLVVDELKRNPQKSTVSSNVAWGVS